MSAAGDSQPGEPGRGQQALQAHALDSAGDANALALAQTPHSGRTSLERRRASVDAHRRSFGSSFLPAVSEAAAAGEAVLAAVEAALRASTPPPRKAPPPGLRTLREEVGGECSGDSAPSQSESPGRPGSPSVAEALAAVAAELATAPQLTLTQDVAAAAALAAARLFEADIAEPPAAPLAATAAADGQASPPVPPLAQLPALPPRSPPPSHSAEKRPSVDLHGVSGGDADGGARGGEPPAKRPKVPSLRDAAAGALAMLPGRLELSVSR